MIDSNILGFSSLRLHAYADGDYSRSKPNQSLLSHHRITLDMSESSAVTDTPATSFEKIQPGGSLIVAWQARGKKCLVVGGGEVASGRVLALLNADSEVTVVSPKLTNAELEHRHEQKQITWIEAPYNDSHLTLEDNYNLVLSCLDDPEVSDQVWKQAVALKIPVNVADVPAKCDFYFGSIYRDGPLQVMISTNGKAPGLARKIRKELTAMFEDKEDEEGDGEEDSMVTKAISNVGNIRQAVRNVVKCDIKARMAFVSGICDQWTFKEISLLNDASIADLIAHFPDIPKYSELESQQEESKNTESK